MVEYRVGRYALVDQLVLDHHYRKRLPANVQLCVRLWSEDLPHAALYLSVPPTRWREPLWELSRLVRTPSCQIPLTQLIRAGMREAKAAGADLVVRFADHTQGHHGGVYQRASWNFHVHRKPACDGVLIDGQFVPGRSCNSRYGTRSPSKLEAILGRPVVSHYDQGKYLYWKSLSKIGQRKAQRLGLQSNPYPKPDRGAGLILALQEDHAD